MNELIRLKNILNELGYLNIYLSLYLKNTQKEDNLVSYIIYPDLFLIYIGTLHDDLLFVSTK